MPRRRLPTLVLAVVVAALTLLAAGCGGGSRSPAVASVAATSTTTTTAGKSRAGSSAATPKGDPSALVSEWAACMRKHGDPDQADPTIDADKVIEITLPAGDDKGVGVGQPGSDACAAYLTAASAALRGGAPEQRPDEAELVKFSECMRANGIPDFPDPSGGGLSLRSGGDLDPSNPAFRNAQQLCGKKTGVQGPLAGGSPQPGMIKVLRAGAPAPGGSGP
jgi:hypothetical protein